MLSYRLSMTSKVFLESRFKSGSTYMTVQHVSVNLLALLAEHFTFVFMMSPKKLVYGCEEKDVAAIFT